MVGIISVASVRIVSLLQTMNIEVVARKINRLLIIVTKVSETKKIKSMKKKSSV